MNNFKASDVLKRKLWSHETASNITLFLWNNIHLNLARTVHKSISSFYQVADQLLQEDNEKYILSVFNNMWYL